MPEKKIDNRRAVILTNSISTRGRHLGASLIALPMMLGPIEHSHAQYASSQSLEEIVVTATRREEGLQSIAASIAAVSGAELDKQGVTGFREMASGISGLELKQPSGALSSAVYIRGVGTGGNTPADPSVGVVIDGVYQQSIGAAFTELLDIQRVEVLRGPQGTLFGKNTTAGVIRIITENPDTEAFSGRLQAVGGNLDNQELRGLVNVPLIDGSLAARFSGYSAKRDGHTKNLHVDEDTRNVDREGWRSKLLWRATDTFNIQFAAENHQQDTRMESAIAQYPDHLIEEFGDILPPISSGRYQQDAAQTWEDTSRYIVNAEWDVRDHNVSLVSSLEKLETFLSQDRDGTILGGEELGSRHITYLTNFVEREIITHELQMASNFEGPLNYILGAFWQDVDRTSTTDLYLGPVYRPGEASTAGYSSQAVFGNVTYAITDALSASLGARYTEDEQLGSNNVFDGKIIFDEWTYSFKLQYQIDNDRMVYFSHDKGFKSGGINRELDTCGRGGACLTSDQAMWDPETTFNYEVGVKSEWLDNRLRLNAALFYQTYEDFQINSTVPGNANVLLTNAAEVQSAGIETEFIWMATDKLTLSGNLAYMETEYETYENAPCPLPTSPGCLDGSQSLSGRLLDNAPKLTYSVAGEYRDALAGHSDLEWFLRVDASFKDDLYLHSTQAEQTRQNSYYLVNARVGIESPDSWRLTFWGRNIADEDYLVDADLSDRGLEKIPGMPRTYGATLDWYF